MISKIKSFILSHKAFVIYFSISVFVTVIDVAVSFLTEFVFDPVIANACGVVTGFIIQYFLTSRHVYNSKNLRTLIIFFLTFLLGLALASGIVFVGREILFVGLPHLISFVIIKFLSIVIPFFVMYFLRKRLIK